MRSISRALIRWAVAPALLVALISLGAHAQVSPTLGAHYAGRSSDTGFSGATNASGAFSASVPLDLPPVREGLPLPLQIVYGGRSVGAAGLGWDIPLSFIRYDTTIAHKRPILSQPDRNPGGPR